MLGGEKDGTERLPMLKLGMDIDGGDRTGVWKDKLPMLKEGTVIAGGARLTVLGIVINGSARLSELNEGG